MGAHSHKSDVEMICLIIRSVFTWRRCHLKFLSTKSFDVSGQDSMTQQLQIRRMATFNSEISGKCADDMSWPFSCRARRRRPFSLGLEFGFVSLVCVHGEIPA